MIDIMWTLDSTGDAIIHSDRVYIGTMNLLSQVPCDVANIVINIAMKEAMKRVLNELCSSVKLFPDITLEEGGEYYLQREVRNTYRTRLKSSEDPDDLPRERKRVRTVYWNLTTVLNSAKLMLWVHDHMISFMDGIMYGSTTRRLNDGLCLVLKKMQYDPSDPSFNRVSYITTHWSL